MKKITNRFLALLLSVILMISVTPISASAAPSTKKTASSVAAVSTWSLDDLAGEKCFYFDSLQEAFGYLNTDTDCGVVTLLKDIELEQPIQFEDTASEPFFQEYAAYGYSGIYFELNGHNVTAPNGNAFEFNNMCCNIFVDNFYEYYNSGNGVDGYGKIEAKDYAFSLTNSQSIVIVGGTYKTETKDAPFYVDAVNGGICNLRHCSILKSDNLVYDEAGYFGNEGNVFLRHVNGDHHFYYHVSEKTDAYVIEAHDTKSTTVTTIAPDRQSATIDATCASCGYVSETENAVAIVGDKGYKSIAAALLAVANGETATVELLTDATLSTSLDVINNKNITLELNNHTLNHTAGYFIINGGALTVQNGTINSTSNMTFVVKGSTDKTAENYSVLNIDNAKIYNRYSNTGVAIFLDNPLPSWNWNKPFYNYGIVMNINKAVIDSNGCGVSINGNYIEGENVNIININESTMISNYETSMYIAGYSNIETTKSKFEGEISGVEIRAGVFKILGGENTFTANTTDEPSTVPNGSGTTVTGAALAVSQHHIGGYGSNPIHVYIEGGQFEGPQAVLETFTLDPSIEDVTTLEIEGGTFKDTAEKKNNAVSSDVNKGFMTGGTYSTEPEKAYVADGYKAIADNNAEQTYTIQPGIVLFDSGNEENDVICEDNYHEVFTHMEVDANHQKVVPFTSIPKLNEPDGHIFTGWTYEKGNFNNLFSMDDVIDTTVKTLVYANWESVDEVQKDAKDEKNVPDDKYKAFSLAGVQIREDGTKDKNGNDVYGGLRFIGSFSEDLIDSLNVGNLEVLEYGFVVATKENAEKNAEQYAIDCSKAYAEKYAQRYGIVDELEIAQIAQKDLQQNKDAYKASYQIKNGNKNVKRVNCMGVQDHRNFNDYRLFTMVIDYDGNEALKDTEMVARAYIAYKDANGVKRIFYNNYDGTNVYGGCSTSYNNAIVM